jgi:hypothetical protein
MVGPYRQFFYVNFSLDTTRVHCYKGVGEEEPPVLAWYDY